MVDISNRAACLLIFLWAIDEGDKSIASATPDTLPPDPTPHISEPAGVSDAQKIDINPSATTAAETSVSNAPTDEASIIPSTKTITGGGATRADSKDIPAGLENAHNMDDNSLPVLVAKPPAEGMSATSGPLEDSFHAEYTGVDDEEDLTGRVEIQEVGGAPVNELESGVGHDGGNIAEGEGTEEQARRDETTIQSRGEEGVETAETQATDTAT